MPGGPVRGPPTRRSGTGRGATPIPARGGRGAGPAPVGGAAGGPPPVPAAHNEPTPASPKMNPRNGPCPVPTNNSRSFAVPQNAQRCPTAAAGRGRGRGLSFQPPPATSTPGAMGRGAPGKSVSLPPSPRGAGRGRGGGGPPPTPTAVRTSNPPLPTQGGRGRGAQRSVSMIPGGGAPPASSIPNRANTELRAPRPLGGGRGQLSNQRPPVSSGAFLLLRLSLGSGSINASNEMGFVSEHERSSYLVLSTGI